MVSHPETSSDSPIGLDRDRGRDKFPQRLIRMLESTTLTTQNTHYLKLLIIG